MAPRGAKGKTASAGRETRSTTLNSKSSSRGGISKRRGQGRVDNDGDLDMGAGATRTQHGGDGNARSRGDGKNGRGASKTAQTILKHLTSGDADRISSRVKNPEAAKQARSKANAAPVVYLRVHGLKASKASSSKDGGLSQLLSFLERKSTERVRSKSRNVIIRKSHPVGDYVFVGVSKIDAEEILKLNTFSFAGSKLEIVETEDGLGHHGSATESKETQELRAKLQEILSQRYTSEVKLLKLDALASDTSLVTLGMFDNRERALKTFKGLMAICDGLFKTAKAKQEAIESISLANNNIDNVSQVESVALTFPQLKNLDMSGNQIANMQAVEQWKGKFKELEALYMTGNPIEANDPNYPATLLEWFPKLQSINGNILRTPEQIAAQIAATQPRPIPQHGPDFRDVNGIAETFLLEFFTAFDTDRPKLLQDLYDDRSKFSLAVDTTSVRDPDAPPPPRWTPYLPDSRNLIKISNFNARKQRLKIGTKSIAECWNALPFTRHPSIKDHIDKYIMDCKPIQGLEDPSGANPSGVDGLMITVHGEFEESDKKTSTMGMRSFSRTFILGPGQPGQAAIRVASDMLSLRASSALPNVHKAMEAPPATAPQQQATPVPSGVDATQRQAMLAELARQTGMTAEYAEMCLTQVNWDFGQALAIFNEKKSALPPEAFATNPQ
ncbi:uncharacterized protein F5Z01DRAFT_495177 [Emericellopsis atlantica]|uniref:mRNA export factor MEX67 n=1 Tax=Emericellopsis atlantica TaxID=2614577 RepID=A0A9P7ZCF7_9HYPO|nr:uncharacterized protein F5Z01DRAFT_495177 [Emericellopsis atlantica]KAG9249514.1 hypothetical protein F5Z01DRAFT_495177 [Emericellopsis atlantica]